MKRNFIALMLLFGLPFQASASNMCLVDSDVAKKIQLNDKSYELPSVIVDCCTAVKVSEKATICFADSEKCKTLSKNESFDFKGANGYCTKQSDIGLLLKLKRVLTADSDINYAMHRGGGDSLTLPGTKILKYSGVLNLSSNVDVYLKHKKDREKLLEVNFDTLPEGEIILELCRGDSCQQNEFIVDKPSSAQLQALSQKSPIEKKLYFLKNSYELNAFFK